MSFGSSQSGSALSGALLGLVLLSGATYIGMKQGNVLARPMKSIKTTNDPRLLRRFVRDQIHCNYSLAGLTAPAACDTNGYIDTRKADGSLLTLAAGSDLFGYQVKVRCKKLAQNKFNLYAEYWNGTTPLKGLFGDDLPVSDADHSNLPLQCERTSTSSCLVLYAGKMPIQYISSERDLQSIKGGNVLYVLTKDISLIQSFSPITLNQNRVILDGGGHSINDLKISGSNTDQVGLFKVVAGNSCISDLRFTRAQVEGRNQVGALAGRMEGSGSNSDPDARLINIDGTGNIRGINEVGGIIGNVFGRVITSQIQTHFTVVGTDSVGGFAGLWSTGSLVQGVTSFASVSGRYYIGGIAGGIGGSEGCSPEYGVVSGLSSSAVVAGNSMVGGIAGVTCFGNYRMEALNTSATVMGGTHVGGAVGYAKSFGATFTNSTSSAKVYGSYNVGGFTGKVWKVSHGAMPFTGKCTMYSGGTSSTFGKVVGQTGQGGTCL